MYKSDKERCSVCGGGAFYGEHYPGCRKALSSKPRPSKSGYGVVMHSNGTGYVVRPLDTLSAPYTMDMVVAKYKTQKLAQNYADKLNGD